MIVVSPSHAHRAERLPFTVECDACDHRIVGESAVVIVVIEMIGRRIVSDEQVRPSVVVVVAPGRPEPVIFFGIADASLFRDLFKRSIAAIVIEQVGLALHAPRSALHGRAFELAKLG